MKRLDLNRGWQLSRPGNIFEKFGDGPSVLEVDLPHDAMIHEKRNQASGNGPDSAWYDGGTYIYEKHLSVPEAWRGQTVLLECEGVAQNAMYFVDGQFAGKCPYAYSGVRLDLSALLNYGGESTLKVIAKTGMQQTSRWYSGSGMFRPAWLWVGGSVSLLPDGVRLTTESCSEAEAVVICEARVQHTKVDRTACRVRMILRDPDGAIAAQDDQPLTLFGRETVTVRTRMALEQPKLWDVDHPNLYYLEAEVYGDETVLDSAVATVGIRTVSVDARHGFRLNGRTLKLRGAGIHHDNGLLGAVTLKDAELRRMKKLKAAGFNAIRSAHNPASRWLLEACDEVGMLVMDELFDVWNESKRDHDYSLFFQEWWERDMKAQVEKDYNHPSVIIYTIGNEIPETGSAAGASQNRAMTQALRALDPTRPIANCINGMFSVMPQMRTILAEVLREEVGQLPSDINALMSMFDANINAIMQHSIVADATEETFAGVDICGYNYMASRYGIDRDLYPNRIILGSETNPNQIGYNWPLVLENDHVIGDFCWTGWDYIGEAGVGKNDYDMTHEMYGPWPWFIAYCGDLDICGHRRPQSYYREIVYGIRKSPYVAVERPEHYQQPKCVTNWTWPDVIESWTWPGFEGKPTHAEVYSDGDEVELLVNDQSLGKKPVGAEKPFTAVFDVIYQPGTLTAVAYRSGVETGRMELKTAGAQTAIALKPDRLQAVADGRSLIYLELELTDQQGNLVPGQDKPIALEIWGGAKLVAFGSANPQSLETFDEMLHTTYDGKALAILSSCQPGTVQVTAQAEGLKAASMELTFLPCEREDA